MESNGARQDESLTTRPADRCESRETSLEILVKLRAVVSLWRKSKSGNLVHPSDRWV